MPKIGVDLVNVNLIPAGQYTGIVQKLDYQITSTPHDTKPGKFSWKKDATQNVDFTAWSAMDDMQRRLHYTINLPGSGKGNIFHDCYMMESARGFLQSFMKACGVPFDTSGFDPEEALGKQITVEATLKDDENGTSNEFAFSKA